MTKATFGEQPTTPPPDEDGAWMWFGGQWLKVHSDTADGVPDSLDFSKKKTDKTDTKAE
jgi:hypothetical protein